MDGDRGTLLCRTPVACNSTANACVRVSLSWWLFRSRSDRGTTAALNTNKSPLAATLKCTAHCARAHFHCARLPHRAQRLHFEVGARQHSSHSHQHSLRNLRSTNTHTHHQTHPPPDLNCSLDMHTYTSTTHYPPRLTHLCVLAARIGRSNPSKLATETDELENLADGGQCLAECAVEGMGTVWWESEIWTIRLVTGAPTIDGSDKGWQSFGARSGKAPSARVFPGALIA